MNLGEQESSYWNAARCCLPNWGTGMCLGWRRGQRRSPRSVRDLCHLLLQLGNALVLVGDRVFYRFQLFQDLIQFGFVLLEDKTRHVFAGRAGGTRSADGREVSKPGAALTGMLASCTPARGRRQAGQARTTRLARAPGCSGHGHRDAQGTDQLQGHASRQGRGFKARASFKDILDQYLLFNSV